ncbi:MAG TPA: CFI-box-CTERM domain-containing protein [Nitrosopumilaceae archaeon]|nr:CFI-box-CTERM domain-containing protein [Nitrosopumilaceae archaeon]
MIRGLWVDQYTKGMLSVSQPQKYTFQQIQQTCKELRAEIHAVDRHNYLILGRAKTTWKEFGHKFQIILEKQDSGTVVELCYNFIGMRGGPYKDFIKKFFKTLTKRIPLESRIKYDVVELKPTNPEKRSSKKISAYSKLDGRCISKMSLLAVALISLLVVGSFGDVHGQTNSGNSIQDDVNSELKNNPNTGDKAMLLIYSNTDWSGALDDSTLGSATIDGSGNRKIPFECSGSNGIYSTAFQKQSEEGYLILAVIQNGKLLNSKSTSAQYGVVSVAGNCQPSFGGGCLIATAAFGSELAPQVQQLRETRDNVLLHTQSGTAFMTAFNQFYYSFSPTVADWERENPIFREMVKGTITPLIISLSILNYVSIHSEAEMLGYGIGIILLNIGVYFAAPVFVILQLRKFGFKHRLGLK